MQRGHSFFTIYLSLGQLICENTFFHRSSQNEGYSEQPKFRDYSIFWRQIQAESISCQQRALNAAIYFVRGFGAGFLITLLRILIDYLLNAIYFAGD